VLATHSPCRPNPLAVILVEILEVKGNQILLTGLDALHWTPILDIKPYEEHFDTPLGLLWEKDPSYRPVDQDEYAEIDL
jgi:tRNA (Thr-GGU) A37 N-methylase